MKKPRLNLSRTLSGLPGSRLASNQTLPSLPGLRFKPGQVTVLPVAAIDWNNKDFNFKDGSDETSKLMGESLERVGQLSPIHVIWRQNLGKAVIVNGFTRAAKLKKLCESRKLSGIEVKVLDAALDDLDLLRMRSHANLQEKYRPSQWWKLVNKAAPLIQAKYGSLTAEILRRELAVPKTLSEVLVKALREPALAKALATDKHGVREIAAIKAARGSTGKAGTSAPGRVSWLKVTANPKRVKLRLVVSINDKAELDQAMRRGMKEIYGAIREFAQKVAKDQGPRP